MLVGLHPLRDSLHSYLSFHPLSFAVHLLLEKKVSHFLLVKSQFTSVNLRLDLDRVVSRGLVG